MADAEGFEQFVSVRMPRVRVNLQASPASELWPSAGQLVLLFRQCEGLLHAGELGREHPGVQLVVAPQSVHVALVRLAQPVQVLNLVLVL